MRTKRLNLEQLEDRCVPSAPPVSVSSGHTPGHYGPLAPQEANATATVDFTPCSDSGKMILAGDPIKLTVTAKDNTVYNHSFFYQGQPALTDFRLTVLTNLTDNGWKAQKGATDGTIVIQGHIGAGGTVSTPIKVSSSAANLKANQQPSWITDDGVKTGQVSTGGRWSLDFAVVQGHPDAMGGNATLLLQIDSYTVPVALTAGMTHLDAANAVTAALLADGFADATVDSQGNVTFLNRPDGIAAMSVGESWSGIVGDVPTNLILEIGIANRFV